MAAEWEVTQHDGKPRDTPGDISRQSMTRIGGALVIVTGTEHEGVPGDWAISVGPDVSTRVNVPLPEAQALAERFAADVNAAVAAVVAKYQEVA